MSSHQELEEVLESYADVGGAHEIDNLRTTLRQAFSIMSEEQRLGFLASDVTMDTMESALCEDVLAPAKDVEALISAAIQHGEDSEPDMEPGDLQVFVREAYGILGVAQRESFLASAPRLASRPTR